ncbi:MAG TPA: hypothetical protein VFJ56_03655, partial [Nitrospira sp.]|nr:hypothetical protein [Nitrospira sp.]
KLISGLLVIREWLWIGILLVRDLEAKFNFTWRSEREHAGPYANAIRIVCQRIRPIDRTGGAGKETGHNARRQVEVGKVEDVVEPD